MNKYCIGQPEVAVHRVSYTSHELDEVHIFQAARIGLGVGSMLNSEYLGFFLQPTNDAHNLEVLDSLPVATEQCSLPE